MAASKRHRKLLQDLTTTTTTTTAAATAIDDNYCITQCNLQLNPIGLCVSTCNFICPSICQIIDSSSSPPPSSSSSSSFSPATSPYSSSSSSPMTKSQHHHHPPLSLPLRISLIFLFVTFSLFFLYTLCKFYTIWYQSRRRRSPPPSPENNETNDTEFVDHPIWYIRTTGLQSSVINAIAVVKFSKDGGFQSDCSVCLSEFEIDETVRLLPNCNHAFHVLCIDTWLRSHTNCPLCRAGIVNNNAGDDSPSPEVNADEGVVIGGIDLGISIMGDDYNRGEGIESSELRIGERDEEDLNKSEVLIHEGNSELLMIRRSVSLDDLEVSDIQSVDGDLGVELTKIDSITEGK